MASSTLAIIITLITVVLFVAEAIPLAMTAMLSSIAMGMLIPEMSLNDIYSGLGSSTVMLSAGMAVVSAALFRTGMAKKIGNTIVKAKFAQNERVFIVVIVIVTAIMSAFLSNVGAIAMFIPLISVASSASKGKIRNKMVVMAAGMGTAVGGAATLVGSTAQQVANNALMATPGYEDGLSLFSMSAMGVVCVVVCILYFATIGYDISKRVFKKDIEEAVAAAARENAGAQSGAAEVDEYAGVPAWKGKLTLAVLVACVVGFVLVSYKPFSNYANIGVVALIGACICICTGCLSVKEAMAEGVDWNAVLILGACTGFAKGLDVSGGGAVIANSILKLFGGENASPAAVMICGLIVCSVLTNFMTNTSLAAMMTPIYISIALQLGLSPIPFVIAVSCIASNIATATPVGTTAVTMTLPAGYRYMDYVKIGGPLNLILLILMCILCPIFYL